GQAGSDSIDVLFLRVTAFRFEKELMGAPLGKLNHFVLNRGAVSWAGALDSARVQRRPMQVRADDLVGVRRRLGNPTGQLFHMELAPAAAVIQSKNVVYRTCRVRMKREPRRRLVSLLNLALREFNRAAIHAAWSARLKSADDEAESSKIFAQGPARVRCAAARLSV